QVVVQVVVEVVEVVVEDVGACVDGVEEEGLVHGARAEEVEEAGGSSDRGTEIRADEASHAIGGGVKAPRYRSALRPDGSNLRVKPERWRGRRRPRAPPRVASPPSSNPDPPMFDAERS